MTDIDHLEKAAYSLIPCLDLKRSFSVQTRLLGNGWPFARYDINNRLSDELKKQGALLDVRKPVQVLSVILTPTHGYMGLSHAENNLSDWAGGARRLKREKGQISRAEFKLTEALELFKMSLPNNGKALDLGAAPGGWTRLLLKQSMHVTAVDPADLNTRIKSDPAVKYIRRTADNYLSTSKERFDVILNDMQIDARESAHLMLSAEGNLKSEGFALLILKGSSGISEGSTNLPISCRANTW